MIAYLMARSRPVWKLAAVVVWFAGSLSGLLLVVAPPPLQRMHYGVRLVGQEAMVHGTAFDLRLGTVEAETPHEVVLDVSAGVDAGLKLFGEEPLQVAWASGRTEEAIPEGQSARMTVRLVSPSAANEQVHLIRIVPFGRGSHDPLTLRVRFQTLPATLPIEGHSGPRSSGRGQDFSGIYSVCASAPAPGDYIVESSHEWLSGDRACNAWSTCTPRRDAGGKTVCLDFTLQGHSECLGPFAGCDPVRNSEGHVKAIFRLRRGPPSISAQAL